MQIHVIRNGEPAGPYTSDQFDELLQKEVLDGDDLYWHEGCDGWLPVSQHPALSQRLAVVLPPPAPPLVPVRRRPASVGNPAKVCWECGHAVSPSAPMCPNCGKRLKMGCGGLFAIGVAVVVLVGAVVVLGGASLLWSSWQQTGRTSTAPTSHEKAPAPAPPATRMPESENDFVFAIQHYVDRYAAAPNELVKTSLRTERRATLTRLLADRQVRGWVGTLKQLSTFSDGKASVVINLDGSPTTVHTTIGNPFSPGSDTSVEPGSALYNRLAQLSPGEKVTFSGSFVPDDQDYLKETSLTEAGAMTEPEFVMRFADVAALAAAAPVSQTPPVARAEASPAGTPPPSVVAASSSTPPTPPTPTPPVSSPQAATPAQASVTTATNSPVGVSIKRRTATTEHDAPGDVLVSFKDGTSSWLTSGEGCSQAKLFARSGTIGWVVNEPPTNHPGDGYTMSYAVRPCHTLVLYQGWRVVAKLESKLTFIEEWNFAEDGTKVALHCRQSHGPGWLQLFEVESGRLLASASEDDEPLPSWAAGVTVATPPPPSLPLPKNRPSWASGSTTANVNQSFLTQSAAPTSTPAPTASVSTTGAVAADSWRWVLYKNERIPFQIPLPNYWRVMQQPPDANANASWIGPKGIILSVYWFDKDDEDDFWHSLKNSAHIRQIRQEQESGPPIQSDTIIRGYETNADVINGVRLRFVATVRYGKSPDKLMAWSVRTPSGMPDSIKWPITFWVGDVVGLIQLAQEGKTDLTKLPIMKNDPLLVELAKEAHPQPAPAPPATAPALLTKAQWKEKMARNFRWYPGTPVMGAAGQFQQIMGKPNRTQTIGDQAYWYYQCSDGTIQLVMNVLNLQAAGFLQADVNDF